MRRVGHGEPVVGGDEHAARVLRHGARPRQLGQVGGVEAVGQRRSGSRSAPRRGRRAPRAVPPRRSARRPSPRRGRRAPAPRPCSGWSARRSCRRRTARGSSTRRARRACGIEAGGRLVEEQDVGVAGEPDGEVQAPALAARQLPIRVSRLASSSTRSISSSGARGREYQRAVISRTSPTVRSTGMAVSCRTIPMRSRRARSPRAGIAAQDGDVAGGGEPVALDDLDGRGLARAVGAEQAEDLAGADRQADVADGVHLSVGLAQVLHFDGVRHGLDTVASTARRR